MSEQLRFEGAGEGETTYTVGGLARRIAGVLERGFPDELWVRGEIQSMSRSKAGHTYFELVERDPGRAYPSARLSVALLAQEREWIWANHVDVEDFRLEEGLEVRVRGRVAYFGPFGKLQLQMTGIDPIFTLGALAAQRDRLVRALHTEGVLAANKRVPMPLVPLRVGLVTSFDSAAYNDALRSLHDSGFAFSVVTVDARVQGRAAATAIVRGLWTVARAEVDAVLLVRGGGSATDLAAFDDERVARAIAALGVPVVTGIGHEVDESIADLAAHTRAKTPTAAAGVLVAAVDGYHDAMEDRWEAVVRAADHRLRRMQDRLDDRRHRVARAATGGLRVAHLRLDHAGLQISRPRLEAVVDRQRRRLAERAGRIGPAARRTVDLHRRHLDGSAERVRLLDPATTLARGWTLTMDETGAIVTDPTRLAPGDRITTRFARGTVASEVRSVAPAPGPVSEPEVEPAVEPAVDRGPGVDAGPDGSGADRPDSGR